MIIINFLQVVIKAFRLIDLDGSESLSWEVTLLLHCCYTVVTLLSHWYHTVITLLSHSCYTRNSSLAHGYKRISLLMGVVTTLNYRRKYRLHCSHTVVTLFSHCSYTALTLLLHCCSTVVALLLHCCYTVATLLSHCCYTAVWGGWRPWITGW
jgi:hypothetical protein